MPVAEPDNHALSGAELFGLGSLQHARNVFDLGLSVNESGGNTGIISSNAPSGLGSQTLFSATMNLNHTWSHYQLTGFYNGGDSLVYPSTNGQGQNWFQDVGIEQTMSWRRWVVRLHDDFLASPEASFGGQGVGGPGLLGLSSPLVALGTISSGFNPDQTILTGPSMRLDNTALAEVDYSISRRSTLTVSGSYGLLHFLSTGFIDNHVWNGQVGFSHSLSPANSIALTAGYSRVSYVGTGQIMENEVFNVGFGRKITSRMALQLSSGPTRVSVYNFVPPTNPRWTWDLSASLKYEWRRAGASVSYVHSTTPGSGVLLGAQSDSFTMSAYRKLSRFWTFTVDGGDAYNTGLFSSGSAGGNFNTYYAGANLDHQMGRHFVLGFNYGLQKQDANSISCPVTSCGGTNLLQIGGVTLSWHPQAIVLE